MLLLATCEREWSNPFDPNNTLAPEAWAPETLQIETTSITERKLTWTYNGPATIQGFKIDRKKGDEAWQVALATLPKETRTWNDTTLIPQAGLTYQYRVYAYAGNNSSAHKTTNTPADIPAPTDLTITKLTEISYKLEWKENSIGEQGFKIDRKTGDEDWAIAFATVTADATSFVDTNVFLNKTGLPVWYRVYGFIGNYVSEKIEATVNIAISSPENFLITVNTQSSVSLSWNYNGVGHQGFKIDKKTNEGDWQIEFAALAPTQNSFTDNAVSLEENTYKYRVYAFILNNVSEKVEKYISKPNVTTAPVINITDNNATSGGNVTDDGGFQVTNRGVCWSTSTNPTIENHTTYSGSGIGTFTSNLSNLYPYTNYYLRAYATNSYGTAYGNQVNFTTLTLHQCGNNFTDPRDNKVYGTVQIGTQCWMKQNLNFGTLVNGLNNQSDNGVFEKYCYDDTESNCNTYGGLYQWDEMMQYTTTQGVQGICPPGWHIPTDDEWSILTSYVSSQPAYLCNNATGFIAKGLAAKTNWNYSSNTCAIGNNHNTNNTTNFTALPGGYRHPNGAFYILNDNGIWWTSSIDDSTDIWLRFLRYSIANMTRYNDNKLYGVSVRCIKDN